MAVWKPDMWDLVLERFQGLRVLADPSNGVVDLDEYYKLLNEAQSNGLDREGIVLVHPCPFCHEGGRVKCVECEWGQVFGPCYDEGTPGHTFEKLLDDKATPVAIEQFLGGVVHRIRQYLFLKKRRTQRWLQGW